MKLRSNRSVSKKIQENRSMKQDESISFIDAQTDISSDEFDVPQTSRKRKKKSSSCNPQENRSKKAKSSKLSDKIDKSSDGVGSCGTLRNNVGLVKKKSGKFGVKIHDRIRKKDLWLGTFGSAEEASKVYWAKKEKLEKEFEARAKSIVRVEETKRTSKYVGVSRRASGKFAAHIRDPIRKKKLYLGAFYSEEEASKVYLAKKEELEREVKEGITGTRWYLGRREFRKPQSMTIRKRRNFGGEMRKRRKVCEEIEWFEDDCIDPCSDDQESSMEIDDFDYSSGESESSDKGISEDENDDEDPCLEDDQPSSRKFDHSDSLGGENATNKDAIFECPIIKEENGQPCLDNQESSKEEINHVVTSQKEAVSMDAIVSEQGLPIQENGAKHELILVNSSLQSPVNPGKCSNANVLLRTNSGTPLMDSNGFLLGEWSWIDDYSLKIN